MNERIIKLAEQAGLEYDFNPMLWLKYEKFAELIVRECAVVAIDHMELNEGTDYGIGRRIKEHFGVEE